MSMTSTAAGSAETAGPRPLLATADATALGDLLRLCAAAGVEALVARDEAEARRSWESAPLVVLGSDLAEQLVPAMPPRRPRVVLVTLDPADAAVWDVAVLLGAETVIRLPDAEAWLVDRLGELRDRPAPSGATVAVIGGRGGAGATVLAASLARVAALGGVSCMLLDADPLGGGVDMVLGTEDAAGLRWPDLATTSGRLSADTLRLALPRSGLLSVLSCGRGDPLQLPVDAVREVLGAARRSHELVVVDLPRRIDEVAELVLSTSSLTLLVVPAEVRATAAAGRVAVGVGLLSPDVRAVVRGPAPSSLTGELVADTLGLPLAGWLDPEPDLPRALEHGRPPAGDPGGPLAALCRALVDGVLTDVRRAA